MAPRTVYGNLADGLQNLSLFDQSFQDTGFLGVIPCTAAGTNAIVLTPIPTSYAPTVTTPQNIQLFSFVATATSTNSVTVQVGSISARNLLRMDGATQAAANDILINVTYLIGWNGSVFQILAPTSNEINPIITGATISASTITTSTYNGNTWTAGTGTLTLGAGKTLNATNSLTLSGTDGTTLTFQGTDTYVGRATTDTLTNKTLTSPTINGATIATSTFNGNTWTAGTGTLTIGAGKTLTANNSLSLSGTDGKALTLTNGLTVSGNDGTLSFGAVSKTVTHNVTTTFGGVDGKTVNFNNSQTFAGTDGTTITFQATDTYVGRATTDTLTNKTIDTAGPNTLKISGVTLATGQYPGETSNGNATAGNIGEYVSSNVLIGSSVALTSGAGANVTSISLGAGDWDVTATIGFNPAATTTITRWGGSIETTSATVSQLAPNTSIVSMATVTPGANPCLITIGPLRVSQTSTNSYFLNAVAVFGTSTLGAFGLLRARRVR